MIGVALLIVVIAAAPLACVPPAPAAESPGAPDTAGTALMEWAYDSWTVAWVQVRGTTPMFAPAAHATLMALACETADLERDRLARHLSAEECEHRMAAIRADQDTALIFRLDLRVFDYRDGDRVARLDPQMTIILEDDRGRRWRPVEVKRGPAVQIASGQKLKRIYYHPPWLHGSQHWYPDQYALTDGRSLTVAEHRLRFARHDPRTRESVLTRRTRWLRLRLAYRTSEWVATWTFRPDEGL